MYREYPAPAPLAPFVECFWRRDLLEDGGGHGGLVLPDGRVDLVWIAGHEPFIAGPQTRFLSRPLAPPFVAVGARFHPSVGPPLLGVPAHELIDRRVPLAAIDTAAATALRRRLPELGGPDDLATSTATALTRWLAAAGTPDPFVREATRLLDDADARVGWVARAVGLSERELLRRFRASVGYGPKTLQRVLRFQRAVAALGRRREPVDNLARIAASAGYADQAHMNRDARELAGLTPLQLAGSPEPG
jgi:AraC-like DNA-binding protein